jgi:hypothetical protein
MKARSFAARSRASWFETPGYAGLLTMRVEVVPVTSGY